MSQEPPEQCIKNSWQSSKRLRSWLCIVLDAGVQEQALKALKSYGIGGSVGAEGGGDSVISLATFPQALPPLLLLPSLPLRNPHGAHFTRSRDGIFNSAAGDFCGSLASSGLEASLARPPGTRPGQGGPVKTRALKPTHPPTSFRRKDGCIC